MQRNSIRQEKEAAAAAAAAAAGNASPGWSGGELGTFQQDKTHRAPPPYPQVCTMRKKQINFVIGLSANVKTWGN